ncbi:MAG TPA: helix-turn-helix transcriptional regulator, partial [Microlunatus sp.]|nr:helix-turn-helix transcriptional regulator [Microlunatus sp.]
GDAGGALRLMEALHMFWPFVSSPKPRRFERLAAVLALPYDSDDRTVLLNRAWACHRAGQLIMKEPAQAREWFEESLRHFHVLGHGAGEATALLNLMEASVMGSDLDAAEAYGDRARVVVRRIDDRPAEAWMLFTDAMLALACGQPDRAAARAREARDVFEERGAGYGVYSAYGIFSSLCVLGEAHYAQGRYADAVAAYGEAVSIQGRTGFVRDVEDLLEDLAIVAAALAAHERAAELLGAAATWRAIDADPRVPYGMADYQAATAASRRSLGLRRWQAAFDAGTRLTSGQAMALANATVDDLAARVSATAVGLTARERQVLSLIADGSHDAEVAERLQLSRRTVQAHLRSVYAKLNVTTRTAAVHRAQELDLIRPVA